MVTQMIRRGQERSFCRAMTIVEMLIAVAIMAVVSAAIIPLFAGIRNSWASKQGTADVIQNGRVLIDHLNRNLSKAVRVTSVSSSSVTNGYIEFEDNDSNILRYDIAANNYIEFGAVGSLSDLAGPVSQLQFICYDGNDFSNPITDVNSIRFVKIQAVLPNSAALGHSEILTTSVYLRAGMLDGMDLEAAFVPGVSTKTEVEYGGCGTVIDSFRSSQGPYNPSSPGSQAIVTVNAIGSEKIVLYSNAILRGDAYIGPGGSVTSGIKTWSGSQITGTRGTLTQLVDIPTLSAPTGPPFSNPNEGDQQIDEYDTLTISSNRHFNRLELWNHSKLIIKGNVTILLDDKFKIGDYTELEILSNSSLNLYVKKTVEVWNYAKLNTSTANPSKLRIYMLGSNKDFETSDSTLIHAVLQNPNGDVNIWGNAQFFGKIKASRLYGGGKIHVDLDADFQ